MNSRREPKGRGAGGSWRRRAVGIHPLSLLLVLGCAACAPEPTRELPLARRFPVSPAARSLTIDSDGRPIAVEPDHAASGGAVGPEAGIRATDPPRRHLYRANAAGAVFGLDPASLRPRWSWAELGLPATALAASPEGDRLYLALADTATGGGRLLSRDVQTGRVLREQHFPFALHSLQPGADGMLYALGGEQLLALRPGPDGFHTLWRRPLDEPSPARLRVAPGGDWLAILAPKEPGGVRLLDAKTGRELGAVPIVPRDGALTADSLYLLLPGEIRVYAVNRPRKPG